MRAVALAITFVSLSVLIAACSGGGTQSSNVMPATPIVRPDKKTDLLYISDAGTTSVYVYTYPQGTLSQTLTGFKLPSGECVDKKGNVFITDQAASAIYEYAHGGSSPIATLQDTNQDPQGCSVDSKSGDLAVANVVSYGGSKAGSVSIYKGAKGNPTILTDPALYDVGYCGYDPNGNLFVDGLKKSTVTLAELPKGGKSLTNLKVSIKLHGAGGVQWDGKYLAVGETGTTVYQFSVSSGKATQKGTTTLTGAYSLLDFWIQGKALIGPTAGSGTVGIWKYPAGGSPKQTLNGFTEPLGATVSAGT